MAAAAPRALTPPSIEIELNGRTLGTGLLLRRVVREEPYLLLRDLRRAVEGDAAPTRLRLDGSRLYATGAGGCDGCALRVTRAVLISDHVRRYDGADYVPLRDVTHALEARLRVSADRRRYVLHAGECRWCVLEPGYAEPPWPDRSDGVSSDK